jgi:outer membrane receptor protein involved in Fe transport
MKNLTVHNLLVILAMIAGIARAQLTTATFYATVTDQSGAAIPSATLSLVHQGTGAVITKTSDSAGEFQFDFLRVGVYTLRIEAQGFKRLESPGIELAAAQNVRRSFVLELGSVTETVNVQASAPLVNAVSAEQRESLSSIKVTELPVARRNISNILGIGTGISTGGNGGVRMNGLGRSGLKITVDGADATSNVENPGTSMYQAFNYIDTMSIEAIQEVQTTKGVIAAEYGHQLAGNVNLISKSGTNQWHGSLFENFQAENLNARLQNLPSKPSLNFNQFGGSIGGPIQRDRLFIFAALESYRERTFQNVQGDFPTQRLRDAAIAAVPAYKVILDTLPLPNQPVAETADAGRFSGVGRIKAHDNHAVVKGDIQISAGKTLALTYSRGRPFRLTPRASEINHREWNGTQERGAVSYTMFGAAWSAETRFGYNYNSVARIDNLWNASLDSQAAETFFGARRLPSIEVPGFENGGGAEFVEYFGPVWSIEQKYTRHAGQHSFKFGGIYTSRGAGRVNSENPRFLYDNRADLLANIPSRTQFMFGNNRYNSHSFDTGFFAQDDWRATPRLVINLGARYDYFSHFVATPVDDSQPAGFFNLDGLLDDQFHFGPFRDPKNPVESDGWINIGPRLGFSYDVGGKGATVIRGGLSVMFGPQPRDDYNSAVGRSTRIPVIVIYSKAESSANNIRFPFFNAGALSIVERSPQTQVGSIFDPHIQNPYTTNLYLGIQRTLTETLMFETAFVGNRGIKYRLRRQYNEVDRITGQRRNPDLGAGRYFDSSQNTVYASWQSSLRQRYSRNLTGSVHYTWGKALAYSGGDTGADFSGDTALTVQDFFDVRANRGPSAGDITHRFIADYIYELPDFPGMNRFAKHAIGGWQISGVFSATTGDALTLTQPSTITASRPDYIGGDPILPDYKETLQYLNRAAFARVPIVPASGAPLRPGNIGVGALRAPGRWDLNFSLGKNFAITERVRLQFRTDTFNFFNHTNLSGITTNVTSGAFGRLTGTTGARVIQLNARLRF